MNTKPEKLNDLPSRLPHRVAVVLAAIVFPLIWVGGLVTTYDAGMSVPDWPGTYGYNMFLYPIEWWLSGPFDLFVEHGHRLLGSLAGLVAIALVFVTVRNEPRGWVKWFSVALLVLVIAQGVLGGMRVRLDARTLAKIHGCVGPAFFASVAGFIVVTSRWWYRRSLDRVLEISSGQRDSGKIGYGLIFFSTLMLAASFGQLVVGAFLRHIDIASPANIYRGLVVLHITIAMLLVLGTFVQWFFSHLPRFKGAGIRGSINILMLLVLTQVMLGAGTWVVKFGWPVWFAEESFAASFVIGEKTFFQMNLITAHVAVGSLILAFWTVHMLRCRCSIGSRAVDLVDSVVGSDRQDSANDVSDPPSSEFAAPDQSTEENNLSPHPLTTSG